MLSTCCVGAIVVGPLGLCDEHAVHTQHYPLGVLIFLFVAPIVVPHFCLSCLTAPEECDHGYERPQSVRPVLGQNHGHRRSYKGPARVRGVLAWVREALWAIGVHHHK